MYAAHLENQMKMRMRMSMALLVDVLGVRIYFKVSFFENGHYLLVNVS